MPGAMPKDASASPQPSNVNEYAITSNMRLGEGQQVHYPPARASPRVPQLRHRDGEVEFAIKGNSPQSLARTFRRDDHPLEDVRPRYEEQEHPERYRWREYDDYLPGPPPFDHGPPRSPPYDLYERRRYSPHDFYDARRRSFSPEQRMPQSPIRARPALSSPHQSRRPDLMSPEFHEPFSGHRRPVRNLSWTAPKAIGQDLMEPEDMRSPVAHEPSDVRSLRSRGSVTIEFNGIKDVPTGPKPSGKPTYRPTTIGPLPPVSAATRAAPHIFISAESLPPDPATVRHLGGFLKSDLPADILVDNAGYYLTWPDTTEGHEKLDQCVANKGGLQLFSMHTLVMVAYHKGQPRTDQPGEAPSPMLERTRPEPTRGGFLSRLFSTEEPKMQLPPTDPHILLLGPPKTAFFVKHLRGFLGSPQPVEIFVDKSGFYLTWPDTQKGHDSLDKCIARKDGSVFYGKYTIRMTAFHDGGPAVESAHITPTKPVEAALNAVSPRVVILQGIEPGRAIKQPIPQTTEDLMKKPSVLSSSPLRVPSRHEGDDASVVSGRTASSDISGSDCHACKAGVKHATDILVLCSTCPRRYHRRCHPSPAIPIDIDAWQCQRCVKKGVEPRPIQSLALQAVVEEDGPPARRLRLDQAVAVGVMAAESRDGPDNHLDTNGKREHEAAGVDTVEGAEIAGSAVKRSLRIAGELPEDNTRKTADPSVSQDHSSEADRLVEASFAAADASKTTSEIPATKPKSRFVRKKIGLQSFVAEVGNTDQTAAPSPAQAPVKLSLGRKITSNVGSTETVPDLAKPNPSLTQAASLTSLQTPASEQSTSVRTSAETGMLSSMVKETVSAMPTSIGELKSATTEPMELDKTNAPPNPSAEVPETPEVSKESRLRSSVTAAVKTTEPDQIITSPKPNSSMPEKAKMKPIMGTCGQCGKHIFVSAKNAVGTCFNCRKSNEQASAENPEPAPSEKLTRGEDAAVKPAASKEETPVRPTKNTTTDVTHVDVVQAALKDPVPRKESQANGSQDKALHLPRDAESSLPSKQMQKALSAQQSATKSPSTLVILKLAAKSKLTAQTAITSDNSVTERQKDTAHNKPAETTADVDDASISLENPPTRKIVKLPIGSTALKKPAAPSQAAPSPTQADNPSTPVVPRVDKGKGTAKSSYPRTWFNHSNPAEDTDNDAEVEVPPSSPARLTKRGKGRPRAASAESLDSSASPERSPQKSVTPAQGLGSGNRKRKRRERADFTAKNILALRPKCTYDELISFALCEAPGHRLQSRSIVAWIANNIPGYLLDGDPWTGRISMTLSANCDKGKYLFVKQEAHEDDEGVDGTGSWWKLKDKMVEKSQRWDPVLKEPVSPLRWGTRKKKDVVKKNVAPKETAEEEHVLNKSWRAADKSASFEEEGEDEADDAPPLKPRRAGRAERDKTLSTIGAVEEPTMVQPPQPVKRASKSAPSRLAGKFAKRRRESDRIVVDHAVPDKGGAAHGKLTSDRHEMDFPSSDEEPLAKKVQRSKPAVRFPPPAAAMMSATTTFDTMADVEMEETAEEMRQSPEPMESAEGAEAVDTPFFRSPRDTTKRQSPDDDKMTLHLQTNGSQSTPFERMKREFNNIEYTALSLSDEWPEHAPVNAIDEEEKAEEIRKRPTRKQMFGKPATYSRLASNLTKSTRGATPGTSFAKSDTATAADDSDDNATQRRTRSPRKKDYAALPALEQSVKECATLDEFLGKPANPMMCWYKGQLAYRDGTRDRQGRLPRGKEYYVVTL
ncbi:hypothetical protein LTR97_007475 [Elasticomyces elasticus]|uniref:PHD-type domain-containing protein n=1 Tax=Elasticomyces elasticus TaxID=574655 RepID=A0AAN7ZZZ1_9PEZI|nr:hypothetical protein LTR97_007475 [Elasticomyces elasticus]